MRKCVKNAKQLAFKRDQDRFFYSIVEELKCPLLALKWNVLKNSLVET